MNGSLFYSYKICHLSLCQEDIMYSSRMFLWLFLRIEATLTKFSLLCKIFRYAFNYKVLHCVKSVRIRSYFGPHFPAFGLNTDVTVSHYLETSQLVCRANQLTGFYMTGNIGL